MLNMERQCSVSLDILDNVCQLTSLSVNENYLCASQSFVMEDPKTALIQSNPKQPGVWCIVLSHTV